MLGDSEPARDEGDYYYEEEAPYLDEFPDWGEPPDRDDLLYNDHAQQQEEPPAPDDVGVTIRSARNALHQIINTIGGSHRSGQQEMCDAVARSAARGRHLIARAPTGIGKSLAYLVPAVIRKKPVVIASATKALQDQLLEHDIPKVQTEFDFRAVVLKGRTNYLCVQKLSELHTDNAAVASLNHEEQEQVYRIVDWAGTTETGDRVELEFPHSFRAWGAVSMATNECPGRRACPKGDPDSCFAEKAIEKATTADVVIVNTTLYLLGAMGQAFLPEHNLVVIDEAHELHNIASETLGVRFTRSRALWLLRRIQDVGVNVNQTRRAYYDLFESLQLEAEGTTPGPFPDHLQDSLNVALNHSHDLQSELSLLYQNLKQSNPAEGTPAWFQLRRVERLAKLATALDADLNRYANAASDNIAERTDAVWTEASNGQLVWRLAPIDVSELLQDTVWSKRTAILSSATIPQNFKTTLGLDNQRHYSINPDSPFDYRNNTLLFVPPDFPDPRDQDHSEAVYNILERLIQAADGRTLALFTSKGKRDAAAAVLRERLPQPILRQGEGSDQELLRRFETEPRTCLFATMGYWQGVDIPGESLSLVTIDRLPFPWPDHPLILARRLKQLPDDFRKVSLPIAETRLGQGVGRLMRSETDRGVVAVLDPRLTDSLFASDLRRSLPPFFPTDDESEVIRFLREIASGRAAASSP